jgi:hypothetical protein
VIAQCIVFHFIFVTQISVLLKVAFSRTVVDLKTCNIERSVPNPSLIYKHKKHRRICGHSEESSI